jgi:rhodanese-related sulfurtransferase
MKYLGRIKMDFITRLFTGVQVNDVSATEAQKKLSQKSKPFLLDVRQPEEFRSGHIAGAKMIPLGDLRARINELPKDKEILVVCRSGNRSMSAARQLTSAGFNVVNLRGGMIAWSRAKLPVSKGK